MVLSLNSILGIESVYHIMKFYLGTSECAWLWKPLLHIEKEIPLFISHRRLRLVKHLYPAQTSWALDSGGFTELTLNGKWTISPFDYAKSVRRYESEIGRLDFCAIQDYMCEPFVLKKTGLSILQHQLLTCTSYLTLKNFNPNSNFIPILQGYALDDYLRHIDLYDKFGISLENRTVGVGSICRRQKTHEITSLVRSLSSLGLQLHGFGVKDFGIKNYGTLLKSADSMAWAMNARYSDKLEGCSHQKCNSCFKFASRWYDRLMNKL